MRIEEVGNVQKALTDLAPFKLARPNSRILRQLSGACSVVTFLVNVHRVYNYFKLDGNNPVNTFWLSTFYS